MDRSVGRARWEMTATDLEVWRGVHESEAAKGKEWAK